MFQSESEGWKRSVSQLRQSTGSIPFHSALLFHSGLQLIGYGPPALGRIIWFTQSVHPESGLVRYAASHGASQVVLVVKNVPANAGDMRHGFDPWVGKIPWRRAWQPTPLYLHGESPWTEEPDRVQSMESQRVRHY